MKLNGLHWVALSTLLLITIVIFVIMHLSFGLVFYATIGGQLVLLYAVYRVLTDSYTTNKTFDDFYEDRPDLNR